LPPPGTSRRTRFRSSACKGVYHIIHEHHTNAIKAYNRAICVQDYQPVDGRFHVPDEPGLGIELNPDALQYAERLVVGAAV
jgi:L-alanine-DL-glutamate epimerase-like enolase superfamily enzyme